MQFNQNAWLKPYIEKKNLYCEKHFFKFFLCFWENYTQVSKLRKAFTNNYSANIKLSKTQLYKIGKSGEFLGRLLRPLLKTGNVLKTLAKSVLTPLGLTAVASATDAAIHK